MERDCLPRVPALFPVRAPRSKEVHTATRAQSTAADDCSSFWAIYVISTITAKVVN